MWLGLWREDGLYRKAMQSGIYRSAWPGPRLWDITRIFYSRMQMGCSDKVLFFCLGPGELMSYDVGMIYERCPFSFFTPRLNLWIGVCIFWCSTQYAWDTSYGAGRLHSILIRAFSLFPPLYMPLTDLPRSGKKEDKLDCLSQLTFNLVFSLSLPLVSPVLFN